MKIGNFYQIKDNRNNGIPFIRIEEISPSGVIVSDWITPTAVFVDTPTANGYVRPNPRRFAESLEGAKKAIRHWKLVPNGPTDQEAIHAMQSIPRRKA